MESLIIDLAKYRFETGEEALASENREKADYLDFFVASKAEAEKQIERAEEFLGMVKDYLTEKEIL